MHIGLFSHHISRRQSFQQNRHITFHALVALKLLVSLISRLVACSARIVVDRQTNRQTDTQTNYCNPRCACAPRVNYTGLYTKYYTTVTIIPKSLMNKLTYKKAMQRESIQGSQLISKNDETGFEPAIYYVYKTAL